MTTTRSRPAGRPAANVRLKKFWLEEDTAAWVELMAEYFGISESDFARYLFKTMRRQPAGAVVTAAAIKQKETSNG